MMYVTKMSHNAAVSVVDWRQGLQQAYQDFARALKQQMTASSSNAAPAASVANTSPVVSTGGNAATTAPQSRNFTKASVNSSAANALQMAQAASMTPTDYGVMLTAQRQAAHPSDPAAIPASSADQLYARTLAPYGARAWATAQGIGGAPETWTAAQARDILGSSAPSLSNDPAKAVSLINARRASAGLTLVTVAQLTPLGTVV